MKQYTRLTGIALLRSFLGLMILAATLWNPLPSSAQSGQNGVNDSETAPFRCIRLEPGNIGFGQIEGNWWIGTGDHALVNLGTSREDAEAAARRLNDLNVDYYCYVDTQGGEGRLQLWLADGLVPDIVARNDTCWPLEWSNIKASRAQTGWIVEGLQKPGGVFASKEDAQAIIDALRRSGTRAQCTPRQDSAFHYFVR